MTEPMAGMAAATARLNQIRATVAAFVEPAPAAASAPDGSTFADVLAQAGADAISAVPSTDGDPSAPAAGDGVVGGPVSAAWSIPWLRGTAPSDGPRSVAAPASARRPGDDPYAVVMPVNGRLTQPFGPTSLTIEPPKTYAGVHYAHFHDGLDLAAPLGRPVRSMADGEVIFAGRYPDGAEVVRVRHADGSIALYAHLDRHLDVHVGDHVGAGQQLGVVGLTGHTTGPHLHLELVAGGRVVDPQRILDSGRLPGAPKAHAAVASASTADGPSPAGASASVLARFDRVAADIPFAAQIRDAARRAGIDPLLLASLVKAESAFHPDSVSRAGAMGLTQLMPATAKAMGVKDPFDPVQNLRAGARYLAGKLNRYGRVDLALAAYQAGSGAVARAGGIPDSPTTRSYVARILRSWAGYQEAAA